MDEDMLARSQAQAEICRIFSNPLRIQILWTLDEGEMSVSELSLAIGATVPNTSHQLRLMKDRDIVTSRREGQTVQYQLNRKSDIECLLQKSPKATRAQNST